MENLILMKTQSSAQTWTWTLDFDLGFVNFGSIRTTNSSKKSLDQTLYFYVLRLVALCLEPIVAEALGPNGAEDFLIIQI